MFEDLDFPVIAAPMAGGPTTPELVAAVTAAGGFGFLAAGYLTAETLEAKIAHTTQLTGGRFGVNLFVPGGRSAADLTAHRERLLTEARRYGVEPGEPRWDDDEYPAKLDLVVARRVPVVSFTFGAPTSAEVDRVHEAGGRVAVTVTSPHEADLAAARGADALVVQGFEAGGHRGLFTDDATGPAGGEQYGLLALLRLIGARTSLPLIATGGLVHGADVAAVLAAGASAAQLGTVFLRADEAGTAAPYRRVLAAADRATAFTRAFSGRPARGLVNRVLNDLSAHAPAAYPQLHHLSKPIRAAAAKAGDPEAMSLWAGQTYPLTTEGPAASIIERLRGEARTAAKRLDRLR
ncbi:NAD(P)H-dependent flavin oxidoreductase [Amycolatopsis saalfeldensis]|uniref:Propionate 3-nitronate monooxygenase n=1 Tax=Amycolatopsis saalfeldensis TaxID=394193 RepID=A0A1H8Y127_9PSEU|nr:nitronate monooxygenase [Amycolatopsis saalfeldensis]SEP45703.1 nitroalkane oxidase [Amycolatopsis saalfeldensis]